MGQEEGEKSEEVDSFKGCELVVEVKEAFEECIDLCWSLKKVSGHHNDAKPSISEITLEMVFNHNNASQPPKDAHVKRVPCGSDLKASLSMPEGRRFLISATAQVRPGVHLRSAWVRTATLRADARQPGWVAMDPMGRMRQDCKVCPCKGYVPFRWAANSRDQGRCRRCGCGCQSHLLGGEASGGGSASTLRERAAEWKAKFGRAEVEPLPPEAVWWSDRECDLWFRTGGLFHPQHARAERASGSASSRSGQPPQQLPSQPPPQPSAQSSYQGSSLTSGVGKRRRVSVLSPTTESRQRFHESLWACFEAQTWPNKELVVVETYTGAPSKFFQEKAKKDSRLVYLSFKVPAREDWSIGLKRNICAQLSMGDIIAHFDDDDLYAPEYLVRMVKELRDAKAQGVKLASWFTFDYQEGKWIHCDPLACSARRGVDETEEWTHKWLYGYGFSYVYLRQVAMEHPFPDVNLGEDYEFITGILAVKGKSSFVLVQDETGICLHTQHSRNTSSSQHLELRELSRREALDLEVADLHPVFTEYLQRLQVQEAVRFFMGEAGTEVQVMHRRYRSLKVHAPDGKELDLHCTAGATADEILALLEESLGPLPLSAKLYWVPAPDSAVSAARRKDFVERAIRLVAPCLALPSDEEEPSPEQHEAAERAERPLNPQDRVGSRTTELWLSLPGGLQDGRSSPYVRVTVQKPADGSVFDSFFMELPLAVDVAQFRLALGMGLPPGARVLVQKPRVGLVDLRLQDTVPDKVTISEFTTQITPALVIPKPLARELQVMMKELLSAPRMQEKISACVEQAKNNKKMLNVVVFGIVSEDIFPLMAARLELHRAPFLKIFQGIMDTHGVDDLEQGFISLELELLMRNQTRTAMAYRALTRLMETLGQEQHEEAEGRLSKVRQAWPEQVWRDVEKAVAREVAAEKAAAEQAAAGQDAAAAGEGGRRSEEAAGAAEATAEAVAAQAKPKSSATKQRKNSRPVEVQDVDGWELSLDVRGAFEECLDLAWKLESTEPSFVASPEPPVEDFVLEMVLDRGGASEQPPPDAHVKRVACGQDSKASLSMPEGRRFFISAIAEVKSSGQRLRSSWVRTATLKAAERPKGWQSIDPMGKPRQECRICKCEAYVPFKWGAFTRDHGRCRRCGCSCSSHVLRLAGTEHKEKSDQVANFSALQQRAVEWKRKHGWAQAEPLPLEAEFWTDHDCDLWFRTGGLFHPQRARERRRPPEGDTGGTSGGARRRVSVLAPTCEARQGLHEGLWSCFEAQTWPDKELVVVETYSSSPSKFFEEKAKQDERVVFLSYQVPKEKDWSSGLKRNLCVQLASGGLSAHFNDGDLYAPEYLQHMVKDLQDAKATGVALTSCFVFDQSQGNWIHCERKASGRVSGAWETEEPVFDTFRGLGFSYVYETQAALDCPFKNINSGEDSAFYAAIILDEGSGSKLLPIKDKRGICLHTTDKADDELRTLEARELQHEEVLDLEVADLQPLFNEYLLRMQVQETLRATRRVSRQATTKPSQRRYRHLRVHTGGHSFEVRCPTGCTAADLTPMLKSLFGGVVPAGAQLCWAPPAAWELAAHVLRVVAPCVPLPSDKNLDAKQLEASNRVRQPIPPQDRIGARTSEVWLVTPEEVPGGRLLPYVRVVVQKPPPAGSVWNCFHVELPPNALVAELRQALGSALPPGARVLARGKNGVADLRNSDFVPDKVTVSSYSAKITSDLVVTKRMAMDMQAMIKVLLREESVQDKIRQVESKASRNDAALNAGVLEVLAEDVLRPVGGHFDLADAPMLKIVFEGMEVHGRGDPFFVMGSLEIALLCRHKERILRAYKELRTLKDSLLPDGNAGVLTRLSDLLTRLTDLGGPQLD